MSRSPRLGRLILRRLLPEELAAAVEGDLEEGFARRLGGGGLRRRLGALAWFWWQVATMPWWSLRRRAARARVAREGADRPHWKPGRESWRWRRLDELLQDLRFAGRGLRRSPGFTVVASLSLGFGIGATSTLFGVIDTLDFRPLPFADSGRLVWLGRDCPTCSRRTPLSEAAEWRVHARSFEDVAFWSGSEVFVLDGDVSELTEVGHASPGLLELLGVRLLLGRTFTPADTLGGAEPVVLLSHETWQRRFGGEPSVLGTRIDYFADPTLTRPQAATVIGILPEDFRLGEERSFWVPLSWRDERVVTSYTEPVGRLRPGVTPAAAAAELRAITAKLATGDPGASGGRDVAVRPLREVLGWSAGEGRGTLFGITALVLLIAIVNVTGLSISRALSRQGELAVRSALGASRRRLARLLLVEGVSLGLLGGAVGVLVVASSMGAARHWFELDRTGLSLAIDFRLLGFGIAVSVLAGILTALLPSVRTARTDLYGALGERSGTGPTSGSRRVTRVLLAVQIASALVLLTGAGLLSAEFLKLRYLDLGFDPRNLYEVSLSAMGGAPELREAPETWRPTVEEVRRRVASESAVTGVALEHQSAINPAVVHAEGAGAAPSSEGRTPSVKAVDASYFATLAAPIIAGRGFTANDRRGERPVAVVNATAATRFWRGEDPLGRQLFLGDSAGVGEWLTVVGVVADVERGEMVERHWPVVYRPLAQGPLYHPAVALHVRLAQPSEAALRAVQTALRTGLGQPARALRPIEEDLADRFVAQRFNALALNVFAGFALLLAAMGIYGNVAYAITRRTREIGVRSALGADRSRILRLVAGQATRVAVTGTALGLVASLGLVRVLAPLLSATGGTQPWLFVGAGVAVCAVASLAVYLPARKATAIDPVVALRAE